MKFNWKALERKLILIGSMEERVLKIPFKKRKFNNMRRFSVTCGINYNTYSSYKNRDQNPNIEMITKIQRGLEKGLKKCNIQDLIDDDLLKDEEGATGQSNQ